MLNGCLKDARRPYQNPSVRLFGFVFLPAYKSRPWFGPMLASERVDGRPGGIAGSGQAGDSEIC
jgi:hypothetical protein